MCSKRVCFMKAFISISFSFILLVAMSFIIISGWKKYTLPLKIGYSIFLFYLLFAFIVAIVDPLIYW